MSKCCPVESILFQSVVSGSTHPVRSCRRRSELPLGSAPPKWQPVFFDLETGNEVRQPDMFVLNERPPECQGKDEVTTVKNSWQSSNDWPKMEAWFLSRDTVTFWSIVAARRKCLLDWKEKSSCTTFTYTVCSIEKVPVPKKHDGQRNVIVDFKLFFKLLPFIPI